MNRSEDEVDPVQASMEEVDVEFQPLQLKEVTFVPYIDSLLSVAL